MARTIKAGFVLSTLLGHKSHAINMKEFASTYDEMDCTFTYVTDESGKPFRFPNVTQDIVLQEGLDGRTELARYLNKADVIFMHTQATALFSADLMKRVPTIVSMDATQKQWFEMNSPFFDVPKNLTVLQRFKMLVMRKSQLKERMYQQVMDNAVHIVAWSEWNKRAICDEYGVNPSKVTVIAPGVSVSRFTPGTEKRVKSEEPVKILFVGGDFRRKGGEMLLRWARTTTTSTPWELHIVTREHVSDCPEHVQIHNNVQNNSDAIVNLFKNCDLFVLPTRADCLPLVLLEAMASGLPIVASRVAAIPEVVTHGKTGFIFDIDDYEQFQSSLNQLIENAEMRWEMSRHAREIALRRWSIEVNYGALLSLIKRVGSEHSQPRMK